ncbi:uncharacterized protein LOC115628620 [Scaptodrosophila lebanonensis]|uniref:Uncharacterized protein LOC115628620 n=1 Tax=Drosophila lebanonensis TaxID=7225 RepID=A0A6J2TYH6_DROLE|nr:uncharacterized protein LOC115628620 [Scaptodrosophila lebanonensis]XP_030380666.1 uncharacterized protein LOC115628620 [Scaptodrosophila lebanonensis]
MFLRQILERKVNTNSATPTTNVMIENRSALPNYRQGENLYDMRLSCSSDDKDNNNNHSNINTEIVNKPPRRAVLSTGTVQLTPLWEHILRTRRLPEAIGLASIYNEFYERLRDPEWQVRQHALRVLVDVLVVMRADADSHMEQLTTLLVDNLGHQAPTVRKGALDCLRVYLAETSIPETVMLHILESGFDQQSQNDSYGRLSCGVLLSIPALLQSILRRPQRQIIVQHIMDRLVLRMGQLKLQEITIKVLNKLNELLGVTEFEEHMTKVGKGNAITQYLQLCKLYGVGAKAGAWRALPRETYWPIGQEVTNQLMPVMLPDRGKVIMETEIKINDDTLTMRILEADTETERLDSPMLTLPSCHKSGNSQSELSSSILQIISDSDVEELANYPSNPLTAPNTPTRALKRVTFGGEVVKMRTPDSDVPSLTGNSNSNNTVAQAHPSSEKINFTTHYTQPMPTPINSPEKAAQVLNIPLHLDIPSDNTKPLICSGNKLSTPEHNGSEGNEKQQLMSNNNLIKRQDSNLSQSLFTSAHRSPTGPVNISPKVPHKQIEVLHNLQRDPSPRLLQRNASEDSGLVNTENKLLSSASIESFVSPKTWEDLDIVGYKTIMNLRSGDWRNRLKAITELELSLQSSSTLALVLPYLESVLRTLLSSERHHEVANEKRGVLSNLISRLPLDNLEDRTLQIITGLCRQDNAGANRVCKALMQRLPAGTIVTKLTSPELLHGKSSKFRKNALQMSIFALRTSPRTCFDIKNLTAQAVHSLLNRKRRVRQAALEVLTVLAGISSGDQILAIVADVLDDNEVSSSLLAAIKSRLSRRQTTSVTGDDSVLYSVDHSNNERYGADVDWIMQGESSASPNAIRKRPRRYADKPCALNGNSLKNTPENSRPLDEILQSHSFHSPPETLANNMDSLHFPSYQFKKSNDGRMLAKACTDTDSTATTCSSGSDSFTQLTSRNLCPNRQSSRFPALKHQQLDVINSLGNAQRVPQQFGFEDRANIDVDCYPKFGSNKTKTHPNALRKLKHNCQANHMNYDSGNNKLKPFRIFEEHKSGMELRSEGIFQNEPIIAVEEIAHTEANEPLQTNDHDDGSPLSFKSFSYSQKSTASAKSNTSNEISKPPASCPSLTDNGPTDESTTIAESINELIIKDFVAKDPTMGESNLTRNESITSLHSKSESIKTQLEDGTPQLSRAQSMKSLAIEEEIEDSNSFVVVERLQHEVESAAIDLSPGKMLQDSKGHNVEPLTVANENQGSANCSNDNLFRNSRSVSLDSFYGTRKQESLDTSTTDNSSQSGSQLGNSSLSAKHSSLQQKSKTLYLLRHKRRVSPVKQAIKISQADLFPQNMTRFEKPREALLKTFDQLDSRNWEVNMAGLKSIVCLMRYHGEYLEQHMHMTSIQLTRSVRNLRSQVARAACQAAAELFAIKSKSLEVECDDLVCALLHRTADTNRFLRADATRALESMVDNVQPPKVINILTMKGAQHQNALVRTASAKLLFRLVERLGSDRVYAMNRESRDKFFIVGANLLLEGSLETRSYAKSLFQALSQHDSYQRLLLETIPPRTYRNVEKTLRNISR